MTFVATVVGGGQIGSNPDGRRHHPGGSPGFSLWVSIPRCYRAGILAHGRRCQCLSSRFTPIVVGPPGRGTARAVPPPGRIAGPDFLHSGQARIVWPVGRCYRSS